MKSLLAGTLCAVVTLALAGCGSSSHHAAIARWSSVGGLSVPTPAGFHDLRSTREVAITDLPTRYLRQTSLPTGYTYPDGVALIVLEAVFPGAPSGGLPPMRLPLSLDELRRGSGGYRPFWGGAFTGDYGVYVWLGPKAPAADRAAVLQALASIKRGRAAT